jgi:hypothetical protein
MPVWTSATCFASPWAHRQPAYGPLHGNTAGYGWLRILNERHTRVK